jgi:hypothetical protein
MNNNSNTIVKKKIYPKRKEGITQSEIINENFKNQIVNCIIPEENEAENSKNTNEITITQSKVETVESKRLKKNLMRITKKNLGGLGKHKLLMIVNELLEKNTKELQDLVVQKKQDFSHIKRQNEKKIDKTSIGSLLN